MDAISEDLIGQLGTKIRFVIPVFGGIPVPDSVFVSWIIIAVLVIASALLTKNLKTMPTSKIQIGIESAICAIYDFFHGIMGEKGSRYIPYLGTVAIFIGVANLAGLIGATPPTKDLNVTAALALSSIFMVEYAGIKERGTKGWLKSFAEPLPIIAPINVLEIFVRPLSLCMRLFGNVLGSFVVMELIKIVVPAIIPIPFSFYFDIFDGLIQAYVFVFLTSLFIKEAIE